MFAVVAVSIEVTIGTAAYAAEETQKAEKKSKKDANKRVCRYVKETGSRIRERVCRRQKDWDRIERVSKENIERSQIGSKRSQSGAET